VGKKEAFLREKKKKSGKGLRQGGDASKGFVPLSEGLKRGYRNRKREGTLGEKSP